MFRWLLLQQPTVAMFLDKALLRPGRFDRIVEVPYPDLASREHILRVHAKSIKIDSTIDLPD